MKTLNDYIAIYKEQVTKGDIQKAYSGLLQYIFNLRTHLMKKEESRFLFGNILQGYMDYTYFYFSNEFLRSKELRFGIVLNHKEIQIELWLLGRNTKVQKKYWDILKTTKWNEGRISMPQYSQLEVVLVKNPDFNHPNTITQEIDKRLSPLTDEIIDYLKNY